MRGGESWLDRPMDGYLLIQSIQRVPYAAPRSAALRQDFYALPFQMEAKNHASSTDS